MTKPTREERGLSALLNLADLLGIDLQDSNIAIATPCKNAIVRMYDDSLEAELVPTSCGTIYVNAPRAPGIHIELVDHQRDGLAPADAIYSISAYIPPDQSNGRSGSMLNGDIATIYIGSKGLILSDAALERASRLYTNRRK